MGQWARTAAQIQAMAIAPTPSKKQENKAVLTHHVSRSVFLLVQLCVVPASGTSFPSLTLAETKHHRRALWTALQADLKGSQYLGFSRLDSPGLPKSSFHSLQPWCLGQGGSCATPCC